jgi:cytochrome c biogenesis protein CcmG, thiol:disulfide interchange protein DsbE
MSGIMLTRSKLALLVSTIIVLAAFIFTGSCSTAIKQNNNLGEGPEIDKYAPDFQLTALSGEGVSLSDYKGKPVVINFWATWCGYCVEEMPLLQDIYDNRAGDGLMVVAVNSGETTSQAKEFMQAYGYSFPVLLDRSQDVTIDYKIRGFPTTFFVDADGVIRDIKVGAFTSRQQIEVSLKKIMH